MPGDSREGRGICDGRVDGMPRITCRRAARESEWGSSSLLMIAIVGVVLVLTASALVLASAVVASNQARTAADLGALSGATALRDGASRQQACAVAGRVVHANRSVLQSCSSLDGSTLIVVAERWSALWPAPALARSRAGPAW